MFKPRKQFFIVLALGILIILLAGLLLAYSQQGQEQIRIKEEVFLAETALNKFSPEELLSQQGELENKVAQSESQLKDVKANLLQSIESIEVTDTLFDVAKTSVVEIITINSPGPTSENLAGFPYSVLTLNVKVEGDVTALIDFILNLSTRFPTSSIKSIEIFIPGVTVADGEIAAVRTEELGKPVVDIELLVHKYEGD
ncbi:hypothetical protein ACFLX0_01555 [Chloroflexota bacterium]